jgi:hypothetical protein
MANGPTSSLTCRLPKEQDTQGSLCLLAHAYLAVVRSKPKTRKTPLKGDLTSGHYPEFIPPTVAEVRLLIRAMTAPEESRGVPTRMVAVSSGSPGAVARRSHQAAHRAKGAAYHDAPRGREPELAESSEASAPTIPVQANNETGLLTDAQWERVIERELWLT